MDPVRLTRDAYEDLVDVREHARAMRDLATGRVETLTEAEADASLAAPTPLAFWRKRRGLTQAALAASVGISRPYLGRIERGRRSPSVKICARLARVLRIRIDDLVIDAWR